jgi:tetratricopeptide (TPR) repeat protein
MRLRHQADRLGLSWNLSKPWEMENQETVATNHEKIKDSPEDHKVDPADLIPEYPSDWIPYDPRIVSSDPFDFRDYFNQEDYADFYNVHYRSLDERNFIDRRPSETSSDDENSEEESNESENEIDGQACSTGDEMESAVNEGEQNSEENDKMSSEEKDSDQGSSPDQDPTAEKPTKRILRETIQTLKDGGNAALKAGNLDLAAHRYDKAIQYGALLFMKNPEKSSGEWNPLIKSLIVTRLNMALLLLKPQFNELQVASRQAQLAIKELAPFCDFTSKKNDITLLETKHEILKLKSKAYFRLGSAQYEMGDFYSSVRSFEESIKSTKKISDPNAKPEQLVVRRLAEAKRELAKQNKRQRKKFKMAISSTTSPLAAAGSGESPSSSASSASSSSSSDEQPEASSPMEVGGTNGVGPCPTTDTASSASTAVVSNTKASPPRGNSARNGNENAVNTAAST